MKTDETLPNQTVTWANLSGVVEEFSDWQLRTDRKFSDEHTELLAYLMDQLQAESESLTGSPLNHPVLGLISHMSSKNNRMRELLFAYLAIVLSQDLEPARRLTAGQRLQLYLHPEYVTATCCYGASYNA
ncbi:hypothetical protein [Pseudomonas sp. CCI3.1]|jgi:hypothetical protein|uniref:hypothetical protein n=1 Tax=Pseudomonas sp. CCI3.1 TaxID=3048618 RepID=UPI002AB45245|nr:MULTISPECIES: hypothetical protein [unclassified Pseudomonas]MDY7585086.1 hypothetical protein [Pseudomonas sp. CCI3.1]MEB0066026.1 hypothetical protein [Pseudomonas sp. CCI3.1]MEB0072950.1 hypothetical protein [Pseudomonas sp. CCI1.4]